MQSFRCYHYPQLMSPVAIEGGGSPPGKAVHLRYIYKHHFQVGFDMSRWQTNGEPKVFSATWVSLVSFLSLAPYWKVADRHAVLWAW